MIELGLEPRWSGCRTHALDPCALLPPRGSQGWAHSGASAALVHQPEMEEQMHPLTCLMFMERVAEVQHTQVYPSLLYNYQLTTALWLFIPDVAAFVLNIRQ